MIKPTCQTASTGKITTSVPDMVIKPEVHRVKRRRLMTRNDIKYVESLRERLDKTNACLEAKNKLVESLLKREEAVCRQRDETAKWCETLQAEVTQLRSLRALDARLVESYQANYNRLTTQSDRIVTNATRLYASSQAHLERALGKVSRLEYESFTRVCPICKHIDLDATESESSENE